MWQDIRRCLALLAPSLRWRWALLIPVVLAAAAAETMGAAAVGCSRPRAAASPWRPRHPRRLAVLAAAHRLRAADHLPHRRQPAPQRRLRLADEHIDERRVETAVRMAQLTEVAAALPQKLDTVIGERGVRLSGGQRQRVAIARALYTEPEVLVFDEATSALDTQTERELIAAIDALRGAKTLVVVAHRLSTVRRCDRLVFLRDGRVAGVGSFDRLMADNADFRAMATEAG